MNAPLVALLDAVRATPGADLKAEVAALAAEYGEELFKLGAAIYKANPRRTVNGPPPGVTPMAELRVYGALTTVHGRVRGIRCIRERINSLTLSEAHALWCEITSGKPYVYKPAPLAVVEREAAEWRKGGLSVDVVIIDGTPTTHEQSFQEAVARVCTAV